MHTRLGQHYQLSKSYALHSACIPCDFGSGNQRLQVACTETQHEPALSRWRMASGGKPRVWQPPVPCMQKARHDRGKKTRSLQYRFWPLRTMGMQQRKVCCTAWLTCAVMAALSNWAPPRQVEQTARTLLARGRRRQQLVTRRALRAEPQRRRARRAAGRAGSAGCGVAGRDVEAGGAAWRRACLCQRRHSVRQWAIEGCVQSLAWSHSLHMRMARLRIRDLHAPHPACPLCICARTSCKIYEQRQCTCACPGVASAIPSLTPSHRHPGPQSAPSGATAASGQSRLVPSQDAGSWQGAPAAWHTCSATRRYGYL